MASDIPGLTLRVIERDGDPWLFAADICKGLGIDTKNVRRSLDADDIKSLELSGLRGRPPLLVSEPGMYGLSFTSRKPEAKSFAKWVRSTVLPAIRRDGSYVMGEEKAQSPEELAALLEAAQITAVS